MCNMKEYLIFLYLLLLPIFFIPFPPCIVFLLLVLDFFFGSIRLKIGHDTYAAVVAVCLCPKFFLFNQNRGEDREETTEPNVFKARGEICTSRAFFNLGKRNLDVNKQQINCNEIIFV